MTDDALHGDICGRTFRTGAERKHVDDAGCVQRTVEDLVEAHVRGLRAIAKVDRRLHHALDLELALDLRHVRIPMILIAEACPAHRSGASGLCRSAIVC